MDARGTAGKPSSSSVCQGQSHQSGSGMLSFKTKIAVNGVTYSVQILVLNSVNNHLSVIS